jgi:hypothetical protein
MLQEYVFKYIVSSTSLDDFSISILRVGEIEGGKHALHHTGEINIKTIKKEGD